MGKSLYTAEAHVVGGRINGHGRTSDGALEVDLRIPSELGGEGGGTNPEQLFAVGYAACFEGALATVARRTNDETGDAAIDSKVMLVTTEQRGFTVAVELDVTLPSVEDPDDSLSPLHHWTWAAPLASFAPVVGIRPDQLVALSSTADSVVATVRQPPGAGTAQRSIDAEQFKADANSDLPSPPGLPVALPGPYFTLTTQPSGTVQVEGWGHGHGLGMSQYGALGKALRGMSAGAILGAYYGPARATRLPQRRIPAEVRVLVSDDHTTATLVGSGPVQVLDDHGQLLGAAPTGALSGDLGPGGIRARVVPRPPVTAPVPPPPLRGRVPAFADVRTPALPPTGPAPGPPALSTGAPQPQPQPAAIVHPPPPPPARIAPLVTTGARSRVPVTALSAGGAGVVVLGALVAVGVRRVRPRRR